jgi:hypothetical protein
MNGILYYNIITFFIADQYFSPVVCFLMFNFGDLVGRIVAGWIRRVSVTCSATIGKSPKTYVIPFSSIPTGHIGLSSQHCQAFDLRTVKDQRLIQWPIMILDDRGTHLKFLDCWRSMLFQEFHFHHALGSMQSVLVTLSFTLSPETELLYINGDWWWLHQGRDTEITKNI